MPLTLFALQFRRENKRKKGDALELHYFPFFGYKEKIERNEEIYLGISY